MLIRSQMREYQRRAADFIKQRNHAGLFLDMGLGKTVSTLSAASHLLDTGQVKRILICAPLRPAEGVWMQEAKKWQHLRHLTFSLLTGTEPKRLQAMHSTAQIHIINVENLYWLLSVLKSRMRRNGWPYDMLIVDESSGFKSPKSKRFSKLRYHIKKFKRRVILTGTPTPKGLIDLWSQMFILDGGKTLGQQVQKYRDRFFTPAGYMGYDYEPDEDAEEKIGELVSPYILTMRAEDYLDLPPTIKTNVWVDLPPTARKLYTIMQEEMFLELELGHSEALTAAVVSQKCWQIANGALKLIDDEGKTHWQTVHDAKIKALDEIVEGSEGNKLVSYYHQGDLMRLRKAYPKAPCITGLKGAAFIKLQDEWNAGKHPIMFIHPQSGGHGLNLQNGGNQIVFFSLLFGHEFYRQVSERIGAARQVGGRFDHVSVKHILVRDTVDEVMLATQQRRYDDERSFIRLLKEFRQAKELLT